MTLRNEPWNIFNELRSLLVNAQEQGQLTDHTKVETSRWLPAVDIKEEKDQYLIITDLPGVKPEQMHITMENNVLVLKGNREEDDKDSESNYYRSERIKGEFYRRFNLPENANGDDIKAHFKHGVLELIIPKKQLATSRKIHVETQS